MPEIDTSTISPLFAWGRSGKMVEKSGWNGGWPTNWQTGWSRVISGTGGNDNNEGIFHSHSRTFSVMTYQYDVWTHNNSAGGPGEYLGHFPPDSMMGVNFSVFGRMRPEFQSGTKLRKSINSSLSIQSENNNVTVRFIADGKPGMITLEIYDILGRLIASVPAQQLFEGENEIHCQCQLTSGTYVARVFSPNFIQSRSFVITR